MMRRILILPLICWLAFVGLLIVFLAGLSGCAQQTFAGTCALKPYASSNGVLYAYTYCEAAEGEK